MSLLNILRGEQPPSTLLSMLANREPLNLGNTGEYLCAYAIGHSRFGPGSGLYRNLIVPTGPRSRLATTEIDVLMVHPTGIFVIESKNYSGWIFGGEGRRDWTVCLKGGARERVPNPIRQNEGHIAALMRLLGLPRSAFVSLIVFSERCELKRVPDDTRDVIILRRNRLVRRVGRAIEARKPLFDPMQLESMTRELDALAARSTADERRAHAARVEMEMRERRK